MESADEKLINNSSRKMRMRAHSFSLSFFSENNSNSKTNKKISKKLSKKSLQQQQQQALNDRIPSLPFQYSRKTATQLNGTAEEDTISSRKSYEWNPKVFRKAAVKTNFENDEFGCCGIPDMNIQSPVLSIGEDSPHQMPFEISTPLDHPACMLFQEHDEDSLDMATLLDHTLVPIMTTTTTTSSIPFHSTRTRIQNEGKKQSTKTFAISSKNMPLYSPSHSSASASSSASCSSSSAEVHQLKSNQTQMMTSLPLKQPRPARSLPSLRSTFARAHSDSVVDISNRKHYDEEQNSLGLCLGTTMLQLEEEENESVSKANFEFKQRSPLRERRQKPPLHINPTNPVSILKSTFSPNSAIPSSLMTDGSIFSPTLKTPMSSNGNSSSNMTLRMRRSKVALLSPPPCPPPTTPLPVLPLSPCTDNSATSTTPSISSIVHGTKETENEKKVESRPISQIKLTDNKAQIREQRGLSFQSVASAQFSENSFDSYQTISRSSYETPMRNSKASMYSSAITTTTNTNEINKILDSEENTKEQVSLDETTIQQIQNPTSSSDVHIIGYAY
jgi:hypothetical protein